MNKIDAKVIVVLLLLLVGIFIGGFQLGEKSGEKIGERKPALSVVNSKVEDNSLAALSSINIMDMQIAYKEGALNGADYESQYPGTFRRSGLEGTRDEFVATLYQPSHTKQLVESAEKSIHDLSTNTVRLNTETNRQPLW